MATTRTSRDKVRVTPLTSEEAKLIGLLTTDERKRLLLEAAKVKAQETLCQTNRQKVS